MARLEAVVRVLEDGRIGLDESLAKYEEGVRLLKACRESLQRAEHKIMLLTGIDAEGRPRVEPFAETANQVEATSRTPRRPRTAARDEEAGDQGMAEPDRQKGLF
jgi:exodeoxyribonuclease VII small subunit